MTEAEFNACTDPQPMLAFLQDRASDRKLRLFALAACWRVRHLLGNPQAREAVRVAGRFVEGLAGAPELADAYRAALAVMVATRCPVVSAACTTAKPTLDAGRAAWVASRVAEAARRAANHQQSPAPVGPSGQPPDREEIAQVALLRDLFGPLPFR